MRIVWVNGCFDVLHRGHIELFKYARAFGGYLVAGVDTDKRVKESKGLSRPFNNLEDRVALLEAIKYIDEIRTFDTDDELETQILLSEAEVIVVGSDYKDRNIIGSHLVEEVRFFDRIENYSTTKILVGLQ